MAQVFLSYDREDGAKARVIAQALEPAGHFVWWDLHIKGGAEYGKVIEQALEAADAVVVLWSANSVDSAWVRDEAAAGRDGGRLIPILIEPVTPPMGFRQYQNLDFTGWKGRRKPPRFAELLASIEALRGRSPQASLPASPPTSATAPKLAPPRGLVIAGLAILAVVALGLFVGLVMNGPRRAAEVPNVEVSPADASSASRALAGNLLVQLGSLQSTDSDALQLVESGADSDADLIFRVGASSEGNRPLGSLALVEANSGNLLWSRDFRPPSGKVADLRQQVAYTAARILNCAAEALSSNLRPQTLKLYLNGCAELHSLWEADPRNLISVFARVTEQAPRFEGGWEKLLLAELESFQNADSQPSARESLQRHVVEARKINPDMAEAYLAEAWLQAPRPINTWMRLAEKAVERNPNNAVALVERARGYQYVGRMRDAIADTRRAVQIDPLSPGVRDALASAYVYSGQMEAGFKVLEEAERLWPGASNLLSARYRFLLRYGDARRALDILETGAITAPATPMQRTFLEARIDRSPALIERAVSHAGSLYQQYPEALSGYMQTLAEFDRDEELIQTLLAADPVKAPGVIEIMFRPSFADVRRDLRFMRIAKRYGLVDYWVASRSLPDFCFEPDLPYDCKAEAAKLR
ncbi:MAG TPA: TIR domain-containing protein [Sphingomicrobium sp.]|jgi:tetratricopeptide (TPR) repeat protein|nr:TIR domain-containing protein [Sphingomicrobium sp.]